MRSLITSGNSFIKLLAHFNLVMISEIDQILLLYFRDYQVEMNIS